MNTPKASFKSRSVEFMILLAASAILFGWFTWPLPLHLNEGVISSHRPEQGGPRYVIPGDHLQLMYHFDLKKGFLTGQTPWFHNLYEFNTGDDTATRRVEMYYAPFSWVYTLGAVAGLPALGWNLASFFSVFFTVWGAWCLVRRFPAPLAVHLTATALMGGFPYRWITLLHGSPTGFAMMYVPWLLYGLHVSITDRSRRGGWIAGLALVFSVWGDIHTFFFMGLLTPLWCLFVFYLQPSPLWTRREILSLFRALSGFIILGLFVVLQAVAIRLYLSDGSMAKGRTLEEVVLFSPEPAGLLSLDPDHPHNHLYLTVSALAALALSGFLGFKVIRKNDVHPPKRILILQALLLASLAGVVILALGPRLIDRISPFYWRVLTRVIPPYGMIRQTTKIYAILPALAAIFLLLPFSYIKESDLWKKRVCLAVLSLGALFLVESRVRIHPTISLLDGGSPAYRAVREQSEARGHPPRALGIVLWPGDSHWTSVKQYFAMMDRIRLVNGYRPYIPGGYFEDIFLRFMPMNQGYVSDTLLDDLLERGVQNVILHEDLFPEQVSPFSVSRTLSGLLAHPRLRLLKQDHAIWAFEITDQPSEEHRVFTDWETASSARMWHLIRFFDPDSPWITQDETAFRTQMIRVTSETGPVSIPLDAMPYADGLRLLLRIRGQGQLTVAFDLGDRMSETEPDRFDHPEWTWVEIPFPAFEGFQSDLTASLSVPGGLIDLDLGTLQIGPSTLHLAVGETRVLPAPTLFRAGYTDLSDNSVVLRPERVAHAEVFYGPRFIFPEGRYQVTLHYQGSEGSTAPLGHFRVREPLSSQTEPVVLESNQNRVQLDFILSEPLPLVTAFTFFRNETIRLKALEIHRLE